METITSIKDFFTDEQWDLIYDKIGNALDDPAFNPEDVYTIRNKIHQLYKD
jgi:hypothetical protein